MLILLTVLFLARAHLLVPIAYLGISKSERTRISQASPKFWRGFWIVAIVPILLYVLSGVIFSITYEPGSRHVAAFVPIAIMGGIWVFWNGWHFAMQQFGILQMYRFRNDITGARRRKFDYFTCLVFAFAGPTLVLFQSGLQSSFFEFFTGRAVFLDPLIQPALWLLAAIAAGVVVFLVVDGSAKLPILMMYVAMFLQLYLLSRLPFVFAVLAVSVPHWLQEVFLVGRMIAKDRAEAKDRAAAKAGNDQTQNRYFIYLLSCVSMGLHKFILSVNDPIRLISHER